MSLVLIYSFIIRAQDPWQDAESMLRQALKRVDPMARSSSTSDRSRTEESGVLYIPMDYYEEEQEKRYAYFFSNEATDWQKKVHRLLRESSEIYGNPEATFILAQLHLWGDYGFPHNKTLAFKYSDKFNNLTRFTNSSVLFDLSVMHSTGFFGEIPVDRAKGLVYLQQAASLGNMQAKQALAYKYSSGTDVPRDCNKALLLYREIAESIRRSFSDEEWYLYPPYVETYDVRLPDLTGGLLGKGLTTWVKTLQGRLPSERPDITSSFLTKMDGGKVWLKFGSENSGASFTDNDDDSYDRIVDIYYTALDEYKGTYMTARDCEEARKILELTFITFDNEVPVMDNLPRFFYAKCIELLGHIYFTGEAEGHPNITLAERYLNRSLELFETYGSLGSTSHTDLGLISQYIKKNDTDAIKHYRKGEHTEFATGAGRHDFQLSLLSSKYPELKLGDPFMLIQHAYALGSRPAIYEFARMKESGMGGYYSCEDSIASFQLFVERSEELMAPQLRTAYGELLKENGEVALWAYAQAAEQGYEAAQVNAACISYLLPRNFEDPPKTTRERKLMSISYYMQALKQGNIDAGVVAGNIYFEMQDYSKSVQLYQSSALRFSPQALWNLGYMYEYGLGVEIDFSMAKRYYDQVLENNPKLYIAVKLSVLKLRAKAWLLWITGERSGYELGDRDNEQSDDKRVPWYKKLFESYKSAFTGNDESEGDKKEGDGSTQNADSKQKEESDEGTWTRLSSLGLHLEDFLSIAFILFLFLFSVIVRIIAARRGWNVNNADVRVNGNHGAHDGGQNNNVFRGNFEVRIAI